VERFDKDMRMRAESMKLHPLRYKAGNPMMGKNFLKPFKMPTGPVKTQTVIIRKTKPVRGLTNGRR
jgi:hypothetical protein